MEVCRRSSWLLLLLGVSLLATTLQGVQGEAESEGPSESECRPYIEKALKELETGETSDTGTKETGDSKEDVPTVEVTNDDSDHQEGEGEDEIHEEGHESAESVESDQNVPDEQQHEAEDTQEASTEATGAETEETDTTQEETGGSQEVEAGTSGESDDQKTDEASEDKEGGDAQAESTEADTQQSETEETQASAEETKEEAVEGETEGTNEESQDTEDGTQEGAVETEAGETSQETQEQSTEETAEAQEESAESEQAESAEGEQAENAEGQQAESAEEEQAASSETEQAASAEEEPSETTEGQAESAEGEQGESVEEGEQAESVEEEGQAESAEGEQAESAETEQVEATEETVEEVQADQAETQAGSDEETKEDDKSDQQEDTKSEATEDDKSETKEETGDESEGGSTETEATGEPDEKSAEQDDSTPDTTQQEESKEGETEDVKQDESQESVVTEGEDKESQEGEAASQEAEAPSQEGEAASQESEDAGKKSDEESESAPEEELSFDIEIPTDLRERNHVEHLLKLDDEASETEKIINRVAEITLRELKKLYENAIKPLEVLYKYRDLSNRHFGDSEIFSKPLILFMGPWSGGKSSIINYLLDNEYNETSLRTGAEPSPAYFNILMYGEEPEILDGTQLAADFTFSGLQKFGQGLEERLRGVRLPNKLLDKVNIVEIPGILEVRKQVSRVFPFNDACQWFIDRADIIFLVYDPSKLDVGPETEAILDQLKGREHQTRIILNKADQVKPEELMRVQGALIWNISPLMSSPQPPIMYTTSLWSRPYESWAPVRLLQAQERAFLRDLRSAVDKRIENKIASARRFAVRVRNHAKMVDCYLTTYYNHKSVFGNRKQVADEIIEHPQDYHIYEGLSTLTNISRYDLPDPDVYRDFFKLNPLYDFQQLSATCTYFRGCPINRLDVAIAYDLPELVGKHKRLVESALAEANPTPVPGS